MDDLSSLGPGARLLEEERRLASTPPTPAQQAAIAAAMERVRAKIDADLATAPVAAAAPASALGGKALLGLAGGVLFAAGVVVGRLSSPATTLVAAPVATVIAPAVSATPAPSVGAPPPPEPSVTATPPVAPASASSPKKSDRTPVQDARTPSGDARLAAERTLIDRARRALQAGRPGDALAAIDEHRALTGGAGQLREERDALDVHALLAAGRTDDARAAAARFHARYPSSAFSFPAVDP